MIARTIATIAVALVAIGLGLAAALRPPGAPPPARGFELVDVTLIEPGRSRRPGVTVKGSARIDSIEPTAVREAVAERFVLPGLIDLHVHHPPALPPGERGLFALLFLAHGVTSVRDAGTFVGSLAGHAEEIARGDRPGPRTFRCGRVLEQAPPTWPGARVVADVEDARAAVAAEALAGADCIKTYNQLSPLVIAAVASAARRHGLPHVAHVPWDLSARRLPGAEIQHLMGLTLDWTRVTPRAIEAYVTDSRYAGLTHTPTLVSFARAARLGDLPRLREEPRAALLPRHYRELLWDPARNPRVRSLSPEDGSGAVERVAAMKLAVEALHAAGVPILAGTDTPNAFVVPGAALQEELGHLVDAGLAPEEALAAATWRAGEALGRTELGRLVEGAPADLLVFGADPTRDLAALASLEAVVADGRVYSRAALDAAVRRHLEHADGWLPRTVSLLAARAALRFF